ncbi:MAG: hypothetical protein JWO19_3781 [Bryobacterales bacterium]|nr:hypothetical protein [Bryobacterales bacterium]
MCGFLLDGRNLAKFTIPEREKGNSNDLPPEFGLQAPTMRVRVSYVVAEKER